jgi:haloalkane dehalogenase
MDPKNVSFPAKNGCGEGFIYQFCRYLIYQVEILDEGPIDAPNTVLLVHGNPTWSFLWRKVISQVTAFFQLECLYFQLVMKKNLRVISPDLVGFGLSSKFRDPLIGEINFQIEILKSIVEHLDLRNLTVVGQDWYFFQRLKN